MGLPGDLEHEFNKPEFVDRFSSLLGKGKGQEYCGYCSVGDLNTSYHNAGNVIDAVSQK